MDNNEWVSVNDRLPDYNVPVLVTHTGDYPKGFNNMQVCYLRNWDLEDDVLDLDWANSDASLSFNDVTHWKHLPEPPTQNITNNA